MKTMRFRCAFYLIISFALSAVRCEGVAAQGLPAPLAGVKRVVFLGDSITWAGGYIEAVELAIRSRFPDSRVEILNLGLPSETVSGLSEPNHAGGAFPRPNLHERLGRVLERARPELVVACYGMNDGIYHPFSEERFKAFQAGLMKLRSEVLTTRAKLCVLTPPVFDPLPIRSSTLPAGHDAYPSGQPFEGYNDVLGRYAKWEMSRKLNCTTFVDIHGALRAYLHEQRKADPAFTLAPDGVHLNELGHRVVAAELLKAWGLSSKPARNVPPEVVKLVRERQTLLRDAWLTETGHKRPGMARGLPIQEAELKAKEIDQMIRELIGRLTR